MKRRLTYPQQQPVMLWRWKMNFETVIGLEVHVGVKTKLKFSIAPFTCWGSQMPAPISWLVFLGVLPGMNKGVIDYGIKAALALNMDVTRMHFDRKNYFYRDNPKAYPNFSVWWASCSQTGLNWARRRYDQKIPPSAWAHLERRCRKEYPRQRILCGPPSPRSTTDWCVWSGYAEVEETYEAALQGDHQYTGISDVQDGRNHACRHNIYIRPYGQEEFGIRLSWKRTPSILSVGLAFEEKRQAEILQ